MEAIRTYTGRLVYPLSLQWEDIFLEDIAHHLAMKCRFNGATKYHYSVAQHSVNCANVAAGVFDNEMLVKLCLLHDAAEAYFPDIPRPLYSTCPELVDACARAQGRIYAKYGIDSDAQRVLANETYNIDDYTLDIEGQRLVKNWAGNGAVPGGMIGRYVDTDKWTIMGAREQFLATFNRFWG